MGSFTDFLHPQSPEKYKHGTLNSPSMQMTAGCLPNTYHTALHEQMINVFMNVKGHAVLNKLKPLTNVLATSRLSTRRSEICVNSYSTLWLQKANKLSTVGNTYILPGAQQTSDRLYINTFCVFVQHDFTVC